MWTYFKFRQSNTRVRCKRCCLDTEASVSQMIESRAQSPAVLFYWRSILSKKNFEKKKQSKTSKIVELYCTKSSICTFSGIQSGVQWLIQMFSIRSWVGVFLSVLSFLSCSECELRLFPPSCESPAALRSLYTTRAETRLLIGCFLCGPRLRDVKQIDDVVARNRDCKQDEAYRRGGKLKSRYTKIPQVHIRTACYLSTRRLKRVARLEQHRVPFSNFTGTPRPLQQPLRPSNPDTILWVRIYSLLLSHAGQLISASPYLDIPAHRFLPDRSGKPIPSWRASSSSGCGRRRRRTAALLQPRRQGEDGEVA